VNPAVGVIYAQPLPAHFRFATSLAMTIPIGMGGDDHPDAGEAAANAPGLSPVPRWTTRCLR
jgi:hypothetical protein